MVNLSSNTSHAPSHSSSTAAASSHITSAALHHHANTSSSSGSFAAFADCSRNAAADSSSPSSTISSLSSLSAASSSLNLNQREPPASRFSSHHASRGHSNNMSRNPGNMNQGGGGHHPQPPMGSNSQGGRGGPYHHQHSSNQQPQQHFNPHHHHQSSGGSHHYYQGGGGNQAGPGGNRGNMAGSSASNAGGRSNMHHNNNNNNSSNNSHHHHNPNPPHHHNHHPPQSHSRSQSATSQSTGGGGESSVEAIDFHFLETIDYPFCTDHGKYEHIAKIGQGTFGEVYKSRCKRTQEIVALKKILTENEKEGFPITALREIKILQVLRHENIVRLIEICTTKATAANKYKSNFYLVFEFCEHDLAGLLSNPLIKFSLGEQKKIMHQLLNGLYYIHKNYILHRDMKTANILVTKDGKLKLADFGLARAVEQKSDNQAIKYTNRVVTLWYRPPELLLGERCYTRAIDMWGAGCIMAELWTKEPILKGNSEQSQLDLIQTLCGSIDPSVWPDVDKLELYNKMQLKTDAKRKLKERLGHFIKDQCALNLLDRLLTLDPKKRIDSDEALDDDFFWSDPMPTDLRLDKLSSSNFEFTAQNNRRGQIHRQVPKPVGNEQHYDRVY